MTMTLHKIGAGDGYTYLTRQVATGDNTDRARDSLVAYYGGRGESPGEWKGRLATAIDVTGTVSEAQMLALFGEGRHPNAGRIAEALVGAGKKASDALATTRLGRPFPIYDIASQFPAELAKAYAEHNTDLGLRARAPIDDDIRAEIRTLVAREMFTDELHRPPADARELSGWIARNTRPDKVAIAGYDLTFSPAKSVSVLWALAPRDVSEQVAAAHDAAVAAVLDRIETEAAYTRQGAHGVRQVKVDGVIAAAFTHRSSRAGDPDLHTHVTVAAKVQAPDKTWLTLDARMLYKGNVTYSEMYNSALETELAARLPGLRFTDVARTGPGASDKRPVRELVGLDPSLMAVMSKRAAAIEPRRAELAAQFVRDHGRTPTRPEQLALAQRATLDTREAKKQQRTHAEEREAWRAEAVSVVGRDGLTRTLERTLTTPPSRSATPALTPDELVGQAAAATLRTVSERRAVWQEWHLRAEGQRQVRRLVDQMGLDFDATVEAVQQLVDVVVERVFVDADVVGLNAPDTTPATPDALLNPDGRSQYSVFRAATFTTRATLAAEARVVATAGRRDGRQADTSSVETAVLESHANGKTLNTGQAALVRDLATSGTRFQLALAPAGSGKTTAMKALARAWQLSGGTVVGLAPSAAAASELAASIGQNADTVDKLVHELDRATADPTHCPPTWITNIDADTLIVIDEVSLASTTHLDRVLGFAIERGASVRGVGDPAQRSSVAAGGVMRDVETAHGAVTLSEVMRFHDPTEGAASLALRAGDPTAIAHYLDQGRVHVGDLDTSLTAVYDGWCADRARGVDAVMLAPLRDQVATLNLRARADRIAREVAAGIPSGAEVVLARDHLASVGDIIQTRRNDRNLTLGTTDFVRNGYRFTVDHVNGDGSVLVRHLDTGRRVVLPAEYLAEHAELGYARTIAASQGMTAGSTTVDAGVSVRVEGASHVLVDPNVMDRESLYVALTRGTAANHAYVVTADRGDEHAASRPATVAPPTAAELLTQVLERSNVQLSATGEAAAELDPFRQLGPAVTQYADAIRVGAVDLLGAVAMQRLADSADRVVPGVTDAPAWPTLLGHLSLLELDGRHRGKPGAAITALAAAAGGCGLTGAHDVAAVLDWRLVDDRRTGPLPWLPSVPAPLASDTTWGPYVVHLAGRVETLAGAVGERAGRWGENGRLTDIPVWARALMTVGAHERSLTRLAVWRAAHEVDDADTRPTGPVVVGEAERVEQRDLDLVASGYGINAVADAHAMTPLAEQLEPRLLDDPYWPQLATRLRAVHRAGIEVAPLAADVVRDGGPLPDEQPAAALWWRLTRHLAPNVEVEALIGDASVRPSWSAGLDELVNAADAEAVLTSAAWPALVGRIDAAARDGLDPAELFADGLRAAERAGVLRRELTTAVLWHVSLLADPLPVLTDLLPPDPADVDLEVPPDYTPTVTETWLDWHDEEPGEQEPADTDPFVGQLRTSAGSWPQIRPPTELRLESSAPVMDLHDDLPPAERVTALVQELSLARAELTALTRAVLTDRGPHVTAVMPQVRALRRRADDLTPFVAAREFARADWRTADAVLIGVQGELAEARGEMVSSPPGTESPSLPEVTMLEQHVGYATARAQAAHDTLRAAEEVLKGQAGGLPVVMQVDATDAWRTAADLDLGVMNAKRDEVVALQDALWRAEVSASRTRVLVAPELNSAENALETSPSLDYGALMQSDEAEPGFDPDLAPGVDSTI